MLILEVDVDDCENVAGDWDPIHPTWIFKSGQNATTFSGEMKSENLEATIYKFI